MVKPAAVMEQSVKGHGYIFGGLKLYLTLSFFQGLESLKFAIVVCPSKGAGTKNALTP